jgi:endoglucanase
MVSPSMSEADLAVLAEQWHGNLIRWQLIRSSVPDSQTDGPSYDQWLEGLLVKTDQVLGWAKRHGVKVVLDLHSPPGGKSSAGGYVAAMGAIFTQPAAQRHFVEVWR